MVKDTLSQAEDQLRSFHKKFETDTPSPIVQVVWYKEKVQGIVSPFPFQLCDAG